MGLLLIGANRQYHYGLAGVIGLGRNTVYSYIYIGQRIFIDKVCDADLYKAASGSQHYISYIFLAQNRSKYRGLAVFVILFGNQDRVVTYFEMVQDGLARAIGLGTSRPDAHGGTADRGVGSGIQYFKTDVAF